MQINLHKIQSYKKISDISSPHFGVLGAEPLGERVASNGVRARGRLSPPFIAPANRFSIFFISILRLVVTFSANQAISRIKSPKMV